MIYTVTFNPAIDYIVRVNNFKIGETNRTAEEIFHPGGKGINVSIMLKRLGVASRAIAFTGGFTGNAIERMLRDTDVDADLIPCEGNTRINIKLKERAETEINGKGVIIRENEINLLYAKLETLQSGDWLVLGGSVPAGMSANAYADILERLADKKIKTVVDASGEPFKLALPFRPFLVKPNVRELEEVFGVSIRNEEEIFSYAKKLSELGAQNVIVSMGGKGALMVSADGSKYKCVPPQGKVIDSVGAGDSLVAGFIADYLETGSYETAFRAGVATGSATAFSEWLAEKALADELKKQIR